MARTARYPRRKVARVGLLTAFVAACASNQPPPGGPPDFSPPVLLSVTPDSGAIADQFDGEIEFRFDEVINENSSGGLGNLFIISPRHEEIDVNWRRQRITLKPKDGWRPGVTYQITMLTGVTDLRTNQTDTQRVVVFSTGGPIPNTSITGRVIDWVGGAIGRDALVEVIRDDSLTYVTRADSTGTFQLGGVAPGTYTLIGTLDANRDQRRNVREAFDSLRITLDSSLTYDLWAFERDTIGPRMTAATPLDSIAINVEFGGAIDTTDIPLSAIALRLLPDSTPVNVQTVMPRAVYDSLARVRRNAAQAALQDSMLRDSLQGDTVALAAALARQDSINQSRLSAPTPSPQDTTVLARLLQARPRPRSGFVIVLSEPLTPGARYLLEATLPNLNGAVNTSARQVIVPTPNDST